MENGIFRLTEEINGQNGVIPNDYDFETGTLFKVTRVTEDSVECVEVDGDGLELDLENNEWVFDPVEFRMVTECMDQSV